MTNQRLIGFLFFLLLLVLGACNQTVRRKIVEQELKTQGCQVKQFISISDFIPVTGADSMKWLQQEYDSLYQLKIDELSRQITELTNNLDSARAQYNGLTNATMKRAYKPLMEGMELRINHHKLIQHTYLHYAEKTQFGLLSNKINYYRLNPQKLTGYWVHATFTGTEGELPAKTYQHNYVFDTGKRRIVSGTTHIPAGH